MPQLVTFKLRTRGTPSGMLGHVHGLACRLLESPDADHRANDRPFAVWPLLRAEESRDDKLLLRVAWLDDERQPAGDSTSLHLGGSPIRLAGSDVLTMPYAALALGGPLRSAFFEWHSATYFSRNDRDLPLPDPVVAVRGWARRWNLFQPPSSPVVMDTVLVSEVLSAVIVTDPCIRPDALQYGVNKQTSKPLVQHGFKGTARFALGSRAGGAAAEAFGTLARFAEYSGTGAQTTYGFGATTCDPDG